MLYIVVLERKMGGFVRLLSQTLEKIINHGALNKRRVILSGIVVVWEVLLVVRGVLKPPKT